MDLIDFRSDTVTRPTDAMRQAMADAEVGDDVMGDDPTINALEERAAKMFGMEAALFVPSGTMGNQIATWVHTGRAGQVVCETRCHIALYEGGAASLLSGAHIRTVDGQAGVFAPEQVDEWVYPDDPHFAATKMVSIENTHNWSGGRLWPQEAVAAVRDHAHDAGAAFHIDGARIFNAAVAQGTTVDKLVAGADSVMFCLSKGLGAPVGSLLVGTADLVHQGRRVRKALGGGMRQAGILAAAGIHALDHHVDRLADDHRLAQDLAAGLADIGLPAVSPVETNMVVVDTSKSGMDGPTFCDKATAAGVGCLPRDNGPTARFVTHLDVAPTQLEPALDVLQALSRKL